MSTYIKRWECCGDTTETDSWEPERCPFCEAEETVWLRRQLKQLESERDQWRSQVGSICSTIPVSKIADSTMTIGDLVDYFKELHKAAGKLEKVHE